jgi:hypothetical protein
MAQYCNRCRGQVNARDREESRHWTFLIDSLEMLEIETKKLEEAK